MLKTKLVLLSPILSLIQKHLTTSLCHQVFQKERINERQRLWSLQALVMFWNEVILRAPQSLTQALQECFGGHWYNLQVKATPEAFFQRSRDLHPRFFEHLFHKFVKRLIPDAPLNYGRDVNTLMSSYQEVWIIDGSRLSAVWKRLKILRDVEAVVLPGCLTVAYDLFRGFPRIVEFYRDAAISEAARSCDFLQKIPEGILLVGDRLYGVPGFMAKALSRNIKVLARYNATVKLKLVRKIREVTFNGGLLVEELVKAGGSQKVPEVLLRHIYWKKGKIIRRLVTTELDQDRLSAEVALQLYPRRWSIERMFYDLKVILGLNHIYCGNPNSVGQQVYASCLVYAAMRVIQGKTAEICDDIVPEDISEKKFFVKIAVAHMEYTYGLIGFLLTREANPKVFLKEPDWSKLKNAKVSLRDILREKRNPTRKDKVFSKERKKWKSFKHIPNSEKYWKN